MSEIIFYALVEGRRAKEIVASKMVDRALQVSAARYRTDFDKAVLGKPQHRALSTSRLSSPSSIIPMFPSRILGLPFLSVGHRSISARGIGQTKPIASSARLPITMSARGSPRDIQARHVMAAATDAIVYPIGVAGQPWGAAEKEQWLKSRPIIRSYHDEVITKIDTLKGRYDVRQYGALTLDPQRYPLYAVMTREWDPKKPSVLITGGVHGYETSGVQGAILFLQTSAEAFSKTFNILVVPCISPWGYETIQRWTERAVDPNRSFNPGGKVVPGRSFNPEEATEQSSALIGLLESLGVKQWMSHIDLHETTDTDETEFRPAKAARDGTEYTPGVIPDGFYLVSDETNKQEAWHTAMIDAVREVTHIAPPDANGRIIDEPVVQEGVIAIPSPRSIGLCAGVTNAVYATTTEVYPDSPKADDDQCNRAQVAAVTAGLDYIIKAEKLNTP